MTKPAVDPQLTDLISAVDTCISLTTAAKLGETAALLRIVKLDILLRTNGISEDELELLLGTFRR